MNLEAIRQAHARISDGIVRTPSVPALALSDLSKAPIYRKLENWTLTRLPAVHQSLVSEFMRGFTQAKSTSPN